MLMVMLWSAPRSRSTAFYRMMIERGATPKPSPTGGSWPRTRTAYFAQLAGPPDPERIAAIWAGHLVALAGPPIEVDAPPAGLMAHPSGQLIREG